MKKPEVLAISGHIVVRGEDVTLIFNKARSIKNSVGVGNSSQTSMIRKGVANLVKTLTFRRNKTLEKSSRSQLAKRKESNKKIDRTLMQSMIIFWTNLDRFLGSFGGQVGAKLAPNNTKTHPTTNQENDRLFKSLRKEFE